MAKFEAGDNIPAAVNHAITKRNFLTQEKMVKALLKNLFTDFFTDNDNRVSVCYNKHDFWIHPCNVGIVDQMNEVYQFKTSHKLKIWGDDQTYMTLTFKNGALWGEPKLKSVAGDAKAFIESVAPFIRIAANYLLPGSGAAAQLFSVEMGKLIDKAAGDWEGVCKKIQTEIVRQMVCNYLYMDRLAFDPVFYAWKWDGKPIEPVASLATHVTQITKDNPATWKWLLEGLAKGERGNWIFDPVYYLQHHKDVRDLYGATNYKMAVEHWLAVGAKKGYRSSFEFDVKWYLEKYPDLENIYKVYGYVGVINHWLECGFSEGRQSSADFDITQYIKSNPDVDKIFIYNKGWIFNHWVHYGKKEGRQAVTLKWKGRYSFTDMHTIHGDVQLVGDTTIHVTGNVLIHGVISGNYKLTKIGKGNLILTGKNTYTGLTVIQEGTLQISDNGSVAGPIENNGGIHFDLKKNCTVANVISGTGYVAKFARYKLILNAANTYTGTTNIQGGTLALGANGSIEHSHSVVFFEGAFILDVSAGNKKIKGIGRSYSNSRIELGSKTLTIGTPGQNDGGGAFTGIITGTGGLTKTGKKDLHLQNSNTYTGLITIAEGSLHLGWKMKEGAVTGNIVHNGYLLHFSYSKDYTYSGVISGTGDVIEESAEGTTLTLNGANTYTGQTLITNTLVLGVNGSIEHSSSVKLMADNAKFNIKAGHKKIKSLYGEMVHTEVLLGSNTLTIGTPGQNDGYGAFKGKFSGDVVKLPVDNIAQNIVSVVKTGKGFFILETQNGTSGTFVHEEGSVSFAGYWAGHYTKAANTSLHVKGRIQFQGCLALSGGDIVMDLTQKPLPKIVAWDVPAAGINTLQITPGPAPKSELVRIVNPNGVLGLQSYELRMSDIPRYKGRLAIEDNAKQLVLLIEKVTMGKGNVD